MSVKAENDMTDEIWGEISSDQEKRIKELYRDALDHLDQTEVPADMTDRIMAGLDQDQPAGENRKSDRCTGGAESVLESVIRHGKVIAVHFGKYSASVAACLVLALGIFTMTSPAGQTLAGLGDGGAQFASELPVKAEETEPRESAAHDAAPSDRENDDAEAAAPQGENSSGSGSSASAAPPGETGRAEKPSAAVSAENPAGASQKNTTVHVRQGSDAAAAGNRVHASKGSKGTPLTTGNGSGNQSGVINKGDNRTDHSENKNKDGQDSKDSDNKESGNKPHILDGPAALETLKDISELEEYMNYQPPVVRTMPDGWALSKIEVIWGRTAQLTYSGQDNSMIYRTAAGSVSLSSGSGSYAYSDEADGYRLEGETSDSISLVTWSTGGNSCSMSFAGPVSREDAISWASSVR